MGYHHFMANIDALVIGRTIFETVASFEALPYQKPVLVLSNQLIQLLSSCEGNPCEQALERHTQTSTSTRTLSTLY